MNASIIDLLGYQFLDDCKAVFAGRLVLHPEKTRLIQFGRFAAEDRRAVGQTRPESFDFLGFAHGCGQDRQGRFQVVRLTLKKRMRATRAALRETLRRHRHEPWPRWANGCNRCYEATSITMQYPVI
jgi:hypothetical protein